MQGEKKIVTTQGEKQTIAKIKQRTSNNKSKVKSKHQQKQSHKQMHWETKHNAKEQKTKSTWTRPNFFLGFISFSTHNPHGGGAIINLKPYNF